MTTRRTSFLLLSLFGLVLILSSSWLFSTTPVLEEDMPFRLVMGSLILFFIPGALWAELLGFRSKHLLETVALSVCGTLSIEVVLLPIPFLFHATIWLWIILLLAVSVCGLVLVFRKAWHTKLVFLAQLMPIRRDALYLNVGYALIALLISLLSMGAYRAGEEVHTIGGEKILHMFFIRDYYCLPMVLRDLGVVRGIPPPNLIHLWEYLIAAWSYLAHCDPSTVFCRARFVIPWLGLPGVYLLVSNIFLIRSKVESIFWCILLMALGEFIYQTPSSMEWIQADDPTRGTMAFLGTVHHSDAAIDVLIALTAGLMLRVFRKTDWRNLGLFLFTMVATFMWHPREFFQACIYAGIFGLTILALWKGRERWNALKRWAWVMGCLVVVPVAILLISSSYHSETTVGFDEFAIKRLALKFAFLPENLFGLRNVFHFPNIIHLWLPPNAWTSAPELQAMLNLQWDLSPWLVASALAVCVLALQRSLVERRLALFYILLTVIYYCWNFSVMMLMVVTYSEIHMVTTRVIYVFSYVVLADFIYLLSRACYARCFSAYRGAMHAGVMLGMGALFTWWWRNGAASMKPLAFVITPAFFVLGVWLMVRRVPGEGAASRTSPSLSASLIGIFCFLFPLLCGGYVKSVLRATNPSRPAIQWFSDDNPFGLSRDLLTFLQGLPTRNSFLVDPLGRACVPVYAAQYLDVVPSFIGNIIKDYAVYEEVKAGTHVLFGRQAPVHDVVVALLNKDGVNYILVTHERYKNLLPYFQAHPKEYKIEFDNPSRGELVVRYKPTTP